MGSDKEIARSKPIKATSSIFKCVVHITKQCEVLLYAKDRDNAIEQAEALTEQELTDYGEYSETYAPIVVKCEVGRS